MKVFLNTTFIFVFILSLISCSTTDSNEKEVPDFVKDLQQKQQIPDSLGLELVPNITSVHEDTLSLNILLVNHGINNIRIEHASNFARTILYKDSNLVYPDPDKLDSYVSYHDLKRLYLPSEDTVQVGRYNLSVPNDEGLKLMLYSVQKISMVDSVDYGIDDKLWLLSDSNKVNLN